MALLAVLAFSFSFFLLNNDAEAKDIYPQADVGLAWTGDKIPHNVQLEHIELKRGDVLPWHQVNTTTCYLIQEGQIEVATPEGDIGIFGRDEFFCDPIKTILQITANQYTTIKRFTITAINE